MAAKNFRNLYIISMLYLIVKNYSMLIHGQPQVPCLFFLGDSFLDNGNNNFIVTNSKVNYYPYGIDYPGGVATGRFSNGKNMADFLAEFLGFEESIPPFAVADDSEIHRGVNYASGGAGILDESGKLLGGCISMNMQLSNHETTISKLALLFGDATLAEEHLNKCLYIVNIGNNDYLSNYLVPMYYQTSTMYTPQEFAAILTYQQSLQLLRLYNNGARKIAVSGIGLLGCIPQIQSTNPTCVDSINEMVDEYNYKLKTLIDTLNMNLYGAQFIFINFTSIARGYPTILDFKIENSPCCVVEPVMGMCDANKEPCKNRDDYLFWDNFHPSENAQRAIAARAYTVMLPTDAYPIDISRLVKNDVITYM